VSCIQRASSAAVRSGSGSPAGELGLLRAQLAEQRVPVGGERRTAAGALDDAQQEDVVAVLVAVREPVAVHGQHLGVRELDLVLLAALADRRRFGHHDDAVAEHAVGHGARPGFVGGAAGEDRGAVTRDERRGDGRVVRALGQQPDAGGSSRFERHRPSVHRDDRRWQPPGHCHLVNGAIS
jgi:hypothetical protein